MAYTASADPFTRSTVDGTLQHPANAAAVTPSDTVDLSNYGRIYAGVAGTLTVIPVGQATDATVAFTVTAGSTLPIRVRRVFATGTTATGLVAIW